MIRNRPIVAITIGYIIGIIMGLYCKISIALLYLIVFLIYVLLKKPQVKKIKLLSIKRYFRYIKIIFTKNVIVLIIIFSVFSNSIVIYKNYKFSKIQNIFEDKKINIEAIILSNSNEEKYKNTYKIKVTNSVLKNQYLYMKVDKIISKNIKYGDKIRIEGILSTLKKRTNYKGFDFKEYLKTKGILGVVDSKTIVKLKQNKILINFRFFNNIFLKIKKVIQENFNSEISNIILGIILGYTDEIDENMKSDFTDSNLAHILAVSGMHVGYILLLCKIIFQKVVGKRICYIITILILIFYMIITGFSASVVRATIMAILILISKIIFRKSDTWTNISLAILILLMYNPFMIESVGLLLSFLGTIAIIIYSKNFKFKNIVLNLFGMTIFITICMMPILAIFFNQIPFLSVILSPFIGILISPIMLLSALFIVISIFSTRVFVFKFLQNIIKTLLSSIVQLLISLVKFNGNIPLAKIIVVTPSGLEIAIYYIILFIIFCFRYIYVSKKVNIVFKRRIKNLINLLKFRYIQYKNKFISIFLIIIIIFSIIRIIPKNLKIYFIDVGQGDSTLIVTPHNKKILIDGGGSESYDVGKNILVPYLLDRKILNLDYIVISHFDTDHVRTEFYL